MNALDRFADRQYCRVLRFFLKFNESAQAIASVGGNHRYMRELRLEWDALKAQLDRLEIRNG